MVWNTKCTVACLYCMQLMLDSGFYAVITNASTSLWLRVSYVCTFARKYNYFMNWTRHYCLKSSIAQSIFALCKQLIFSMPSFISSIHSHFCLFARLRVSFLPCFIQTCCPEVQSEIARELRYSGNESLIWTISFFLFLIAPPPKRSGNLFGKL